MDSLRAGFFGFFGSTECSSSCGGARPAPPRARVRWNTASGLATVSLRWLR